MPRFRRSGTGLSLSTPRYCYSRACALPIRADGTVDKVQSLDTTASLIATKICENAIQALPISFLDARDDSSLRFGALAKRGLSLQMMT